VERCHLWVAAGGLILAAALLCGCTTSSTPRVSLAQSASAIPAVGDVAVVFHGGEYIPFFTYPSVNPFRGSVVDTEGLPLKESRATLGVYYRNPVTFSQLGLTELNNFRLTQDRKHLLLAMKAAGALAAMAETDGAGALWLPYSESFPLTEGDAMSAPWYSAMAQGEALALFVRLGEVTGNSEYEYLAHATFRSLEPTTAAALSGAGRWVAYVDGDGCYWLEEYPMSVPTHVLNGHMFAIVGLYDYARTHREDLQAERLLRAAIWTVKDKVAEFRVPLQPSRYSLKWAGQRGDYHSVHIRQLRELSEITGDRFFSNAAEAFASDYTQ